MAVNTTAKRLRTIAAREMNEQIAFGMGYLTRSQGGNPSRLAVTKKASPNNLEAVIRGRDRPTSLARFTKGTKRHGRTNPKVQVSGNGQVKEMTGSFLIGLNSGNIGLAIRLKPGKKLKNKKTMVPMYASGSKRKASDANLYLLYGPSVDQVFRDVSADVAPEGATILEKEFMRLLDQGVV